MKLNERNKVDTCPIGRLSFFTKCVLTSCADEQHFRCVVVAWIWYFVLQGLIAFYDYNDSNAIGGDSPNWQAYLIKRHYLVWLRDHSTHWRATCRYNTDGTVYTDYMRAAFEDFDIVRVTPKVVERCQTYELLNIRGNECANCTASTFYLKDVFPLHIDSSEKGTCEFDGSKTGDVTPSEDNFGLYLDVNPKFRCTSSSDATTQFWIGGVWFDDSRTHLLNCLSISWYINWRLSRLVNSNKEGEYPIGQFLVKVNGQLLQMASMNLIETFTDLTKK